MGDVEAQPVGRDQRALLRDMIAQRHAQRLVQQVGRRMVGADGEAARVIDAQLQRHAADQFAVLDDDLVHEEVAELLARVGDAGAQTGAENRPVSPTWPPHSP